MKKGQKRKQTKSLKRRSERRNPAQQGSARSPRDVLAHVRQARTYPIEGCWIMPDWEQGGIAVIVVARRQPNGNIVYGNYLVDMYCLGLKNTFFNGDVPARHFRREILPKIMQDDEPQEISPAMAHEIIYGAIDYAQQFGFRPQRDYRHTQYILDPPGTYLPTGEIAFGFQGKPLFVSGPNDNVDAILRQLERTAGVGNFNFMVGIGGPPFDEFEVDDEWDEDDDELEQD